QTASLQKSVTLENDAIPARIDVGNLEFSFGIRGGRVLICLLAVMCRECNIHFADGLRAEILNNSSLNGEGGLFCDRGLRETAYGQNCTPQQTEAPMHREASNEGTAIIASGA